MGIKHLYNLVIQQKDKAESPHYGQKFQRLTFFYYCIIIYTCSVICARSLWVLFVKIMTGAYQLIGYILAI